MLGVWLGGFGSVFCFVLFRGSRAILLCSVLWNVLVFFGFVFGLMFDGLGGVG